MSQPGPGYVGGTAAQAMAKATARLRAAGVSDPARDARILLAHAARIEASRVTLIAPEELLPEVAERYEQLIALRAIRVPVSHLIGEREFYGRRFKVSGDVLDPRPETECLIEAALAQPFERVLDLGLGSGCILVTLLAEQPRARSPTPARTTAPNRHRTVSSYSSAGVSG